MVDFCSIEKIAHQYSVPTPISRSPQRQFSIPVLLLVFSIFHPPPSTTGRLSAGAGGRQNTLKPTFMRAAINPQFPLAHFFSISTKNFPPRQKNGPKKKHTLSILAPAQLNELLDVVNLLRHFFLVGIGWCEGFGNCRLLGAIVGVQ